MTKQPVKDEWKEALQYCYDQLTWGLISRDKIGQSCQFGDLIKLESYMRKNDKTTTQTETYPVYYVGFYNDKLWYSKIDPVMIMNQQFVLLSVQYKQPSQQNRLMFYNGLISVDKKDIISVSMLKRKKQKQKLSE